MIINPTSIIRLIQRKNINSRSSHCYLHVTLRSIWKTTRLSIYLSITKGLRVALMRILRIVFRMKINNLPTLTLNILKLISKVSPTSQMINSKLENRIVNLHRNFSKEKIRRLQHRHFNRKNQLECIFQCQIRIVSRGHVFCCLFCWLWWWLESLLESSS